MKLGDVFKLSSGKSLPEKKRTPGTHNVYGGNGITGNHNDYFVDKPTIVIGRVGEYCGAVHLTTEKCWITDNALMVTEWYQEVDKQYLVYVLNAMNLHQYAKTVGQPSISQANVYGLDINLPLIEQQQETVKILNLVSKVIVDRKEELKRLDDLIKARFVEMFGECKNSVRLGDCCEVHARIGWQALTRNEHMKTGDYMLVTGTDFKDGEINYSTCVYVAKERYEMDKHIILRNDDVLITKDGTIGKVAIVHNLPKPATLNAGVFVVRPDERFNKEYIANVFKGPLFSDYVEVSKTGATIKHLNQKHLVEFMIPVPSLEEQEAFAQFTQQTDKSKFPICV